MKKTSYDLKRTPSRNATSRNDQYLYVISIFK